MNRNLRISLLGLGSVAAVAAPVALAVSCGDGGSSLNDPNTLDVGMEVDYAPYNFAVTNEVYNMIHAQAESTTDITTDNGLTHDQAVAFMGMIAPVQGGGWAGGYDVFWANKMAEELGQPVLIHAIASAGLTPSLFDRHEVDINIAGSSWNTMRQERGQVSHPYFMPNNVLLYRKDVFNTKQDAIAAIQAGNAGIAAQKGTTWVDIANNLTSTPAIESDTETLAEMELGRQNTNVKFVVTENTRAQTLEAMDPEEFDWLVTSDLGTVTGVANPTLDPETDRICMILPKQSEYDLTEINRIIDEFTGATQLVNGTTNDNDHIDYTQNAPTINWNIADQTAAQNVKPQLDNAAALAVYANAA